MLNVLMSAYDRIGARTENFRAKKLFQKDTILKLHTPLLCIMIAPFI